MLRRYWICFAIGVVPIATTMWVVQWVLKFEIGPLFTVIRVVFLVIQILGAVGTVVIGRKVI